MVVQRKVRVHSGEHCRRQPDRRAVADDDDVPGEGVVVEEAHSQVGEHRHVPVQDVVAALATGQRHVELAAVPPLVDGVELGDGVVVVAVFQLPDLRLVDASDLVSEHVEFSADNGRRLRRPQGHRVREQSPAAPDPGRTPGPDRGPTAVSAAPGGRVSNLRSTLASDWPCRSSTRRPLTALTPRRSLPASPPAARPASASLRPGAVARSQRPARSARTRGNARPRSDGAAP